MQYLKEKHGYRAEIGEGGGGTVVAGLRHGGGRTQEAEGSEAVEDEEAGLLGSVLNKRFA